jgi:hypothetical protein
VLTIGRIQLDELSAPFSAPLADAVAFVLSVALACSDNAACSVLEVAASFDLVAPDPVVVCGSTLLPVLTSTSFAVGCVTVVE